MFYQVGVEKGEAVSFIQIENHVQELKGDDWYKISVEANNPHEAIKIAVEEYKNTLVLFCVFFKPDSTDVYRAYKAVHGRNEPNMYTVKALSLSDAIDIATEKRKAALFSGMKIWHVWDDVNDVQHIIVATNVKQVEAALKAYNAESSYTVEDTVFIENFPHLTI
jgi:hypothetical protein